jgi:hypothetical protein
MRLRAGMTSAVLEDVVDVTSTTSIKMFRRASNCAPSPRTVRRPLERNDSANIEFGQMSQANSLWNCLNTDRCEFIYYVGQSEIPFCTFHIVKCASFSKLISLHEDPELSTVADRVVKLTALSSRCEFSDHRPFLRRYSCN